MTLHIVASGDFGKPAITVVAAGSHELQTIPLAGPFAWRIHQVRRCVGDVDEAGKYVPCPTNEPVSIHRQCTACSGMENMDCVFEPRCQDNPAACTCITSFRDVTHVVYIAFHGTLAKVGMTQERRVEHRLREQGADAWFVVDRQASRGAARQSERRISVLYKIPEHRSHRETLPQLARPVPWSAIEQRAAELRLRLEGAFDMERSIHRIEDHPVPQPLEAPPRRVASAGVHRGSWIGNKGNHLIYREAERPDRLDLAMTRPYVALKRSDLVGRSIDLLDLPTTR